MGISLQCGLHSEAKTQLGSVLYSTSKGKKRRRVRWECSDWLSLPSHVGHIADKYWKMLIVSRLNSPTASTKFNQLYH